jgi:hypothetical protein
MKVALQLCFEENSIKGKDFIQIFSDFVRFDPILYIKNSRTKPWDEFKHKKEIANSSSCDSIIANNRNYDLFITTDTAGIERPHRTVKIVQDLEIFKTLFQKIENVTEMKGFISAFLFDDDYTTIQSAKDEGELKRRGLFDKLEDVKYCTNKYGEKEIETIKNPGRIELANDTYFLPAFRMWFSPAFFKLVTKERVIRFNSAYNIIELPSGIVFVQLFENIEESSSNMNKGIQREFRKWMGFDEIINC